ncbi:hypothetical protein DA73_0400027385 [Tolypothrix bouteillei VB521301]|uniref:Uncharacterized protein n=1 Tax=Tolypothrix bouteillei VB521301 TaxID=1479485 RepID=A0A8S9TFR7_9CYAN|nr:hypothetical protein DA73_0400027385 [Tolypothrix bouteillei VB521301]
MVKQSVQNILRTKQKGETTVEDNNQAQNGNTEQVEKNGDKPVPLESPGTLEVRNTLAISGIRPVSASNLQVVETRNVMGVRPIGAHTFDIVDTLNLSGVRPIGSSELVISQTYSVMGNRPVASNEVGDTETLMGFLD